MSSASFGLAQDLQRATVTRGLAAGPERLEGKSRYSSLSSNGRPSGVSVAGEGPTASILKGPVTSSTIGEGGDVTYLSPFWEGTARK